MTAHFWHEQHDISYYRRVDDWIASAPIIVASALILWWLL